MLKHDGFAILPGVVPPDGVTMMRKGGKDFIGTDALLAQTQDEKMKKGSKEIKVIRNRNGDSDAGLPERWETHFDWKGNQALVDLAKAALNEHAPELAKRWKRSDTGYTSAVLTRKLTTQQRWHMDMSDWRKEDKKLGLDGEWLLVFMVLYGNKESGSAGAGPDLCPFWPTKYMYGKEKPSNMVFTRPVLAPGDLVIVRSTMLHRGGGGMDRAVGFVPFPPMNSEYGGFGSPWLPASHGMTIQEISSAQAP